MSMTKRYLESLPEAEQNAILGEPLNKPNNLAAAILYIAHLEARLKGGGSMGFPATIKAVEEEEARQELELRPEINMPTAGQILERISNE